MRFQTRLRKHRLALGLSQVEVAEILELKSTSSLSRWERGERLPNTRRLLELSALYQRMVNDLMFPHYVRTRARIHQRRCALKKTKQ